MKLAALPKWSIIRGIAFKSRLVSLISDPTENESRKMPDGRTVAD